MTRKPFLTGPHGPGDGAGPRAAPVVTRWGYLDHTADVAFWAEAPDLPGLFHAATEAVLGLLLERPPRLVQGCPDRPSPVPRGEPGIRPPSTAPGGGEPRSAGPDGRLQPLEARLTAPDLEGLLVGWINELLYWVQDRRLVPVTLALDPVPGDDGWVLAARGWCTPLDVEAMGWQGEIKAATYHQLEIARLADGDRGGDGRHAGATPGGGWRARVVLDV